MNPAFGLQILSRSRGDDLADLCGGRTVYVSIYMNRERGFDSALRGADIGQERESIRLT